MTEQQPASSPPLSDARAIGLVHPVDLVVSLIILSGVAFLFYETTQFDEVSPIFAQNIQPSMYPQIVLTVIAIFASLMPFEHLLLAKKGTDIDKERRHAIHPLTLTTMAFLVAVVAAAEILGMLLTMIVICLLMPRLWGLRKLTHILVFATVFPVTVALVFSKLLSVYFDAGIFGIAL